MYVKSAGRLRRAFYTASQPCQQQVRQILPFSVSQFLPSNSREDEPLSIDSRLGGNIESSTCIEIQGYPISVAKTSEVTSFFSYSSVGRFRLIAAPLRSKPYIASTVHESPWIVRCTHGVMDDRTFSRLGVTQNPRAGTFVSRYAFVS